MTNYNKSRSIGFVVTVAALWLAHMAGLSFWVGVLLAFGAILLRAWLTWPTK